MKTKSEKTKISVVIACYMDAQAMPIMHERLVKVFQKINTDYEIIFVNDGSPDNSEEVLQQLVLRNKKVIGINHSRNFNSQSSFQSGIDIATGDAVVLMDGDLQDPPELIEKFYKKWQEGYDVVYGVRKKREGPILMEILAKLFYRIFRKLSFINIPLDAGEFSLMDKKVVEAIRKVTERNKFIRGIRAWVGFKQTGVTYVRPKRMFGRSTNNIVKNVDWAIRGILNFSYTPLRIITFFSFFLFVFSVLSLLVLIIIFLVNRSFNLNTPFILFSVLFIGSLQLLCISIIGEYIGKIFEEVKQRPHYIVKNVIGRKET